jgi:hypothetical protein
VDYEDTNPAAREYALMLEAHTPRKWDLRIAVAGAPGVFLLRRRARRDHGR